MYPRIYKVTRTGLGAKGRSINARATGLPDNKLKIEPAFDGLFKLPAPKVGDDVMVWELDDTHQYRYYLPIRGAFSSLSNDPTAAQLESAGPVEIDGTQIVLGANASEAALLGDTLVSVLGTLCDALALETHPGSLPGIPTGPPINAAQYAAVKVQLETAKSLIVKLK